MARRRQLPANRSRRRERPGQEIDKFKMELPGPLRVLTNPKLFIALSVIFVVGMLVGLLPGVISSPNANEGPIAQANEAPDVPVEVNAEGTAVPVSTAVAKRYTAPPPMVIDASKTYTATIKTGKGDISVELYPQAAPEAVNAFVFLARDGYYSGTPFMELVKNPDGSKFYAQAGDPTRTGLGTPGFSIKKEQTARPFARGALGMGGSAENSNGGQFFISFGDYPALNGKYTIFGQVVGGLDVLDRLSLLDVTDRTPTGSGDEVQSIEISES
ncbi:MAG: peptidylprolyl isomerase [Dehalococcoidia bacterium]|nr:peptidylprolyl isomerase [Dehalococcoidia bacterium]